MIKGFGGFAFLFYLGMVVEIGTFGHGFAIWILSLMMLAAGIVSAACFYIPIAFEKEGLLRIQAYARIHPHRIIESIHAISEQIRKDGLLSLESVRSGITDQKLLYVTKKMMEGFDQKAILPVLRNDSIRAAQLFQDLRTYQERIASIIPILGLVATLTHLMMGLSKADFVFNGSSLIPFLISLLVQLMFTFWTQHQMDEWFDCAQNYHAVMEEGASGLLEGIHADLLRDRLLSRITHA